jgi:hypothetical protein
MIASLLTLLVIAPAAALPHDPGWHVGSARIPNGSCPRCVQVDSWSATVPYRDKPNDFPQRTMARLGRNDVIIQISRSWQPSMPRSLLKRHPLRIAEKEIHPNFEGNTTHGRVSLWATSTWRNGSFVTVYVFFGSPRPTSTVVARAQHELDNTRFATWSIKQ